MLTKLASFYNTSTWIYKLTGLHYGFYYDNTKSFADARQNETDFVQNLLDPKTSDTILDAGCGFGDDLIHLAKTYGCKAYGISISPKHVEIAKNLATSKGVATRTTFGVRDYTNTKLKSKFFNGIYGIESVCYCSPRIKFLKEAYRLLKPGGKLVISDGYLNRLIKNSGERKIYKKFINGFCLPDNEVTYSDMTKYFKEAGFVNVKEYNKLKEVMPYVRFLGNLGFILLPITWLLSFLPISQFKVLHLNNSAGINAKRAYSVGLAAYYVHEGTKP